MVRVINADPGMGTSMTKDEAKEFMTTRTILHIGTVDKKGESNVTPVGYYFDNSANKIYIPTHKNSKKVRNLSNKKIISFCIDDPNPPYKGVRGKGEIKVHEEHEQWGRGELDYWEKEWDTLYPLKFTLKENAKILKECRKFIPLISRTLFNTRFHILAGKKYQNCLICQNWPPRTLKE